MIISAKTDKDISEHLTQVVRFLKKELELVQGVNVPVSAGTGSSPHRNQWTDGWTDGWVG